MTIALALDRPKAAKGRSLGHCEKRHRDQHRHGVDDESKRNTFINNVSALAASGTAASANNNTIVGSTQNPNATLPLK
jgi:hypothetical protein